MKVDLVATGIRDQIHFPGIDVVCRAAGARRISLQRDPRAPEFFHDPDRGATPEHTGGCTAYLKRKSTNLLPDSCS